MEIQELFLKHYGKFDQHRILLKPGINIIYGGNETGKSTIHSFVRAMLFGLSRGRGKAARTDEYQVRQPWDNPMGFSGSMQVLQDGKSYRIDRNFDSRSTELTMVCTTDNREITQPDEVLREILGGIGEAAFVNTFFIAQAGGQTDDALAQELRRCMVNQGGTEYEVDVTAALQSLRKKKKQAEQKKKKEEEILGEQIDKKQSEANFIRRELELLREQKQWLTQPARQEAAARAAMYEDDEWDEDDAHEGGYGVGRILLQVLLALAGILALIGALVLQDMQTRLILAIFGLLFLVFILPVRRLIPEEGSWEREGGWQESEETKEQLDATREEIRRREDYYRKLQEDLEQLYHSHVRAETIDTEIAALELAIDRICELTVGIYEKSGGSMNQRASEILSALTEGRYQRIVMDDTGEIRIHTPSRVLGLHQVSGGTMQQIYFAVRMAAGELLLPGIQLPVILDETFAQYDDERLEAALTWLHGCGRQVLLFTCQKREREILEKIRRRTSVPY